MSGMDVRLDGSWNSPGFDIKIGVVILRKQTQLMDIEHQEIVK